MAQLNAALPTVGGRATVRLVDSFLGLGLLVVLIGVFLYALHLVVRAAVREGVQQALRADLLSEESRKNINP